MKTLNVLGVFVAVAVIALAGIAVVAAASLLVQPVSASGVMTSTTTGGEEQATVSTTNTATNNNSNAVLGSMFFLGSVNRQASTQSMKHILRYHLGAM